MSGQRAFDTPANFIHGLGPQRSALLLQELGIATLGDFLQLFPFRYVDRTKFYEIAEITADLPYVQIKGKITRIETVGQNRSKRLVAHFSDGKASIELVWFQGMKWIEKALRPNHEIVVFGKPNLFNGKYSIPHPEIEEVSEVANKISSALQPVYPTTEKLKAKGLDSKGIAKVMRNALALLTEADIYETLPVQILQQYHLMSRFHSFRNIHFPSDAKSLQMAQFRLKFEELFFVQLRLLLLKQLRMQQYQGFLFSKVGSFFNEFYTQHLPFALTNAQKRVVKEIRTDMGSGKQMNRLLQGDVGSGKTLVALLTMLIALDNSYQAALIAPTEILANQHYASLSELLAKTQVRIALLTGSTKKAERKILHEALRSGELHILIGTHALFEDEVVFNNLGLVVIDEQHRFGVAQRAKLWKKNTQPPHVLIMSATPIPRTLAMTLYGDLDVSIIDELPAGRKPITTLHKYDSQRLAVYGFMREQIALGRQVYVVYPLIEESEKLDLKNLMEGYNSIVASFPAPQYQISIVHGQMTPADKEYEMQRFIKRESHIMVATTVIEVGVNVPNASLMIIENAERFGLSQLHQLRGRVGRGAEKSFCILMTSYKLGADSKTRIATMVKTQDGFEIAEVDLKLRGPGELAGTQQSGAAEFKIADLSKDAQLVQLSRQCATQILQEDPEMKKTEHLCIAQQYHYLNQFKHNWSRIS